MSTVTHDADQRIVRQQFSEDPAREPHERQSHRPALARTVVRSGDQVRFAHRERASPFQSTGRLTPFVFRALPHFVRQDTRARTAIAP